MPGEPPRWNPGLGLARNSHIKRRRRSRFRKSNLRARVCSRRAKLVRYNARKSNPRAGPLGGFLDFMRGEPPRWNPGLGLARNPHIQRRRRSRFRKSNLRARVCSRRAKLVRYNARKSNPRAGPLGGFLDFMRGEPPRWNPGLGLARNPHIQRRRRPRFRISN